MFVLPKGTLVKVGGMPFRLLADVVTDGLEANYRLGIEPLGTSFESAGYNLALSQADGVAGSSQAESPVTCPTKIVSSGSMAFRK